MSALYTVFKATSFFFALIAISLCLITSAPLTLSAYDKEGYEAARDSFNKTSAVFYEMKGKVDAADEFFNRFRGGINQWRGAVNRETQDQGIEAIDRLADDMIIQVIDGLYDKATSTLGIPDGLSIPQSMKERALKKLRDRFKGSVPAGLANRLGYMYTLSELDNKLREGYVYENLRYIKQGFDKGSRLVGSFKNAVEFIDLFSPQSAESTPVGRLIRVKEFLGLISGLAKPIPLMGNMIDAYANTTEGFMTALNNLDARLKEARQGSLCGQRGLDAEIQYAFQNAYPQEDCLSYLAISSAQYPHLSPIRGWIGVERNNVFLWFNGEGIILKGANFDVMYRYLAALRENTNYSSSASHERFMNLAKAASKSSLPKITERFSAYYRKFEKDYRFREALEFDGYYKDGRFISLQSRVMEYQLGSSEDEFSGLCFFNPSFRNDVEALYSRYKDAFVINGNIRASVRIGSASVMLEGVNIRDIRCADHCTFKHISLKERYTLKVSAEGFQEVQRVFTKESYPSIILEPITIRIEADRQTITLGGRIWLRAVVSGRDVSKDRFYWTVKGKPIGNYSDRVEYSPAEPGPHQIHTTLLDERGKPVLEGRITITVLEKMTISIAGPTEMTEGQEGVFTAQSRTGHPQASGIKYAYTWVVDGRTFGSNDRTIKTRFQKTGGHIIKAEVWQWITEGNRWLKIDEAVHNVSVIPARSVNKTTAPSPTPLPSPSPVSPTAPPKTKTFAELNQKEKQALLDCLCRCSSTAASHLAVYYDTNPDGASPSCNDTSNGPCVNKGFGCWRHKPTATGACPEGCFKKAVVQGIPEGIISK